MIHFDGIDDVRAAIQSFSDDLKRQTVGIVERVGDDALRYWRSQEPYRTGALRRACRVRKVRDRNGLLVGLEFRYVGEAARRAHVSGPGRVNPAFRNRIVQKWLREVGIPRIVREFNQLGGGR